MASSSSFRHVALDFLKPRSLSEGARIRSSHYLFSEAILLSAWIGGDPVLRSSNHR
ncbi:MAG: hypothetical protein HY812_15145 [Planctomycetes bacterium]|nr:hypothetical protein [Planctomycetota bacterium]